MNTSQTQPHSSATPLAKLSCTAADAISFRQQCARGDLAGLRQYLARTLQANAWHDRILMLAAVAPAISLEALEALYTIEPHTADLALIRCACYSARAVELRGSGPINQVPQDRLDKAADCVRTAIVALEITAKFDPTDPTPFACIVPALAIFDQHNTAMYRAFLHATSLAPELAPLLSFGVPTPPLSTRPN